MKLLGVQHRDRIEAHGTQCRDTAGGERDEGQHHGDAHEGRQIVWRYAEEQSGYEVGDDERAGHAQHGASGGQAESLA